MRGAPRGEGARAPRGEGARAPRGESRSSTTAPRAARTDARPGARAPRDVEGPRDLPGIKNPYVRFRPLKKPPVELHATTLWDYPSQHYGKTEQGSQNYRGATPSHVIWNVIQRTTKEEDLVVDPFCGSGTTLDVCRDLHRRGKGFDVAPTRAEIDKGDARELGKLVRRESAHLVFMDPPYADNLTYSDDPSCIGKLAWEDGTWSAAMRQVLRECHKILKVDGHLAIFVSDILLLRGPERRFAPLGHDLARAAEDAGFTMVDWVAVVRHGKALDDPRLRARGADEGFMLRGFSHLVLLQKRAPSTSRR